jgi:hypothetical protein
VARAKTILSSGASIPQSVDLQIKEARVQCAAGKIAEATESLQDALNRARKYNMLGAQFEARLALSETEMKSGNIVSARTQLVSLEHDARAKGFVLIAHQADAARKRSSHN